MKKVLFVINALDGGGAEKSLVSLLNELEQYKDEYSFDLLIPNKKGLFYNQIPDFINEITVSKSMKYMANGFNELISLRELNPYLIFIKLRWVLKQKRLSTVVGGIREQELWKLWRKYIPNLDQSYDVAISYMNGYPNYYVIDKVNAKKKYLWIHNEYQKLGYDVSFDKKYYEAADGIITISDLCKKSIIERMPQIEEKVQVLENISSGKLIYNLAKKPTEIESFNKFEGIKILSIGRLVEQKNFKLAVDTAKYLKDYFENFNFKWFIIGKGPLKENLQDRIKKNALEDYIELIGTTDNPYAYMQQANVLVQTSIFEGKSIVLDEAKILSKFIVATNYPTVYDSIQDGITGVISEQTPEKLAEAIFKILTDEVVRAKIDKNLKDFRNGNVEELQKYINLIEK